MTHSEIEKLYQDNYEAVKSFAIAMCQNDIDAEDIVQDAFLSILENSGNIDGKGAKQYLYRAVHNQAIDFYRSKANKKEQSVEEFPQIDTDCQDHSELHKALSELPDRQAMAIWLKYWKNMSYEDIAIEMECTVAAVEGLLDRAKNKLRELMHGC